MEISTKELRGKLGRMIEHASRGMEVIITVRGKKMARLVPFRTDKEKDETGDELFGLWKDREDIQAVEDYVRTIRQGRVF